VPPEEPLEPAICVACSVFRDELEALRKRGELDLPVRYLDSMLHMRPKRLETQLTAAVGEEQANCQAVVLVYGDCHAYMNEQVCTDAVARTAGINCCEILLGASRYRELRREGHFFLLPEWARRWKEILHRELGLHGENARDFMQEMHTRLLYLDTGLRPIPTEHLEEASRMTGLPWDVLEVPLDHLAASIRSAFQRIQADDV